MPKRSKLDQVACCPLASLKGASLPIGGANIAFDGLGQQLDIHVPCRAKDVVVAACGVAAALTTPSTKEPATFTAKILAWPFPRAFPNSCAE